MDTFEHKLWVNAEDFDDRVAIFDDHRQLSYRQLWADVEAEAEALGDRDGQAVVFRASQSVDFAVRYFAIHRAGGVAVALDHDTPEATFLDIERRLKTIHFPAGTADVLFTTGTTSRPKGVVVSHEAILSSVRNLVSGQGYDPRQRMIIHGPISHIGSLSKLWTALYCGAEVCLMDGLKDLNAFFRHIDESPWRATTFLVPAQIQMLLRFCGEKLAECSKKLDFIETGAAPIALADMQALRRAVPQTRLYNTYASTETGIVSTYDFQHGECLEGCLGRPEWDTAIAIDPTGHVVCKGPTLMTGYVGDGEIVCRPIDGTFRTADLGRIDDCGRLHLLAREDDIINVGGFKVSPVEVESALMEHPQVADCLCTSMRHDIMGRQLRMLVVMRSAAVIDRRELSAWLRMRLEAYKVPAEYEQVDAIAKTFNGKPDRKRYREE